MGPVYCGGRSDVAIQRRTRTRIASGYALAMTPDAIVDGNGIFVIAGSR
jgi:hypothetical protein